MTNSTCIIQYIYLSNVDSLPPSLPLHHYLQREVVFEDLERLSDQYQQLTSTYEEQRGQLADSRSQAQRLESELEERETEIGRLHLQQRRSSSSSSRVREDGRRQWLVGSGSGHLLLPRLL